jgi:hypothetical protein
MLDSSLATKQKTGGFMRVNRFLTAAVLAAGLWGCASSGAVGSGSGKNSSVITESEITASNQQNAYDVVERLRPNWISLGKNYSVNTYRVSSDTTGAVLVYVDDVKQGEIEALRNIPVSYVTSIQWLDAATATAILPGVGLDIITGAIVVHTRRKK